MKCLFVWLIFNEQILSQFLLEISSLIFDFLYWQLNLCQNKPLVYISLSHQMWFHNLLCHEDIIISATLFVSIVVWVHCCNISRSQLQMLYSVLYRWLKTADCQLIFNIFEQIVHFWSDHQWFLDQRSLMLMLSSSFSSHIALATAEYTAFVIDKSFIIDSHKSSSCLDNDKFCLDF